MRSLQYNDTQSVQKSKYINCTAKILLLSHRATANKYNNNSNTEQQGNLNKSKANTHHTLSNCPIKITSTGQFKSF